MIEKQTSTLFTKKKIVLLSLSLLVTLGAIVFSVMKVINVNLSWIFRQIGEAITSSRRSWLLLLLFMPIYFSLFRFLVYWNWLRMYHVKAKWYDWMLFSLTSRVLGIITPFGVGAQPFNYFWLRTNKLNHSQAISVITCSSFIEILVGSIITWPSFIYLAIVRYGILTNLTQGSYCFYLIIVGMFLDLVVTLVYFFMGFSRHCHIFFSSLFNRLIKLFHIKYKSHAQIYYEYKQNAVIKKQFIQELKKIINPFLVTTLTVGCCFVEYSSMFFALELLGNGANFGPNFTYMEVFNSINVATTANNFIPIPGGEGTTQFSLQIFLNSFLVNVPKNDAKLIEQIINGGILVWRFFSNYVQIFVWLVLLPLVFVYYIRKVNQTPVNQVLNS